MKAGVAWFRAVHMGSFDLDISCSKLAWGLMLGNILVSYHVWPRNMIIESNVVKISCSCRLYPCSRRHPMSRGISAPGGPLFPNRFSAAYHSFLYLNVTASFFLSPSFRSRIPQCFTPSAGLF